MKRRQCPQCESILSRYGYKCLRCLVWARKVRVCLKCEKDEQFCICIESQEHIDKIDRKYATLTITGEE